MTCPGRACDAAWPRIVSTSSLAYAGFFFLLYVAAHLVVRYTVPFADPYLLPIAALLTAIGLTEIYRLHPADAFKQATWIVLAVGPGLDWWAGAGVEMPVAPGDHVVFPASAGVWVEIDEERLLVCRVTQMLGVLVSASMND